MPGYNDALNRSRTSTVDYRQRYQEWLKKSRPLQKTIGLTSMGLTPLMMFGNVYEPGSLASEIVQNRAYGGYYGLTKGLSDTNRVYRALRDKQYEQELGRVGKVSSAVSGIYNLNRFLYGYPQMISLLASGMKIKGLGGARIEQLLGKTAEAILPSGDTIGRLLRKTAGAILPGSSSLNLTGSATLGSGVGVGNKMLKTAASSYSGLDLSGLLGGYSMAPMLGMMGLQMVTGMMKQKKLARIRPVRKQPEEFAKKYSGYQQFQTQFNMLNSGLENQMPPWEALKLQVQMSIERAVSAIPHLVADIDEMMQSKRKAVRGTKVSEDVFKASDKKGGFFDALNYQTTRLLTYNPFSSLLSLIFTGKTGRKLREELEETFGRGKYSEKKVKESAKAAGFRVEDYQAMRLDPLTILRRSTDNIESQKLMLMMTSIRLEQIMARELTGMGQMFGKKVGSRGIFSKIMDLPGLDLIRGLANIGNVVDKFLEGFDISEKKQGFFKSINQFLFGKPEEDYGELSRISSPGEINRQILEQTKESKSYLQKIFELLKFGLIPVEIRKPLLNETIPVTITAAVPQDRPSRTKLRAAAFGSDNKSNKFIVGETGPEVVDFDKKKVVPIKGAAAYGLGLSSGVADGYGPGMVGQLKDIEEEQKNKTFIKLFSAIAENTKSMADEFRVFIKKSGSYESVTSKHKSFAKDLISDISHLFSKATSTALVSSITYGIVYGLVNSIFGEDVVKPTAELGAKVVTKSVGKVAIKSLGKKIPVLGALIAIPFAMEKWNQGDTVGAILEVSSGIASVFPGIGTAVSFGVDALIAFRDIYKPFEGVNSLEDFLTKAFGKAVGAKVGAKLVGKLAAKAGFKSIAKKIPIVGALLSIPFAMDRWKNDDKFGAILEVASGIASIFPGIGTAISLGIDAINLIRDVVKDSPLFNETVTGDAQSEFTESFGGETEIERWPVIGPLVGLFRGVGMLFDGEFMKGFKKIGWSLAGFVPGLQGFIMAIPTLIDAGKDLLGKFSGKSISEMGDVQIGDKKLRDMPIISGFYDIMDGFKLFMDGEKWEGFKLFSKGLIGIIPGGSWLIKAMISLGSKVMDMLGFGGKKASKDKDVVELEKVTKELEQKRKISYQKISRKRRIGVSGEYSHAHGGVIGAYSNGGLISAGIVGDGSGPEVAVHSPFGTAIIPNPLDTLPGDIQRVINQFENAKEDYKKSFGELLDTFNDIQQRNTEKLIEELGSVIIAASQQQQSPNISLPVESLNREQDSLLDRLDGITKSIINDIFNSVPLSLNHRILSYPFESDIQIRPT